MHNICGLKLLVASKKIKETLQEKIFQNGAMFIARTAASDDVARRWLVVCDEET